MYKIFIVEDDSAIANAVKKHLDGWGFLVKIAEDFREIAAEYERFSPHLTLLDIGLPFHNGFYWCEQIRKTSKAPVVFLSSASDNMNIVLAMNMGGDDFIAKPFDLSVLMAKINAILRRCYDFSAPNEIIEYNGAALNIAEASLVVAGEKIELTKNEFRILLTLMQNRGKIVSREELMRKLWETDCYVDDNTLTVNVSRLRKKIENHGLENFISTKAGMGYILE
ncbi:MAG: response regulator transcription factor [[Eubacterium] saphenum]|nr:response regulator transcription factor [[Eubacterium] saphenum]